jgi:hypothetical protein
MWFPATLWPFAHSHLRIVAYSFWSVKRQEVPIEPRDNLAQGVRRCERIAKIEELFTQRRKAQKGGKKRKGLHFAFLCASVPLRGMSSFDFLTRSKPWGQPAQTAFIRRATAVLSRHPSGPISHLTSAAKALY